MGKSKCIFLVSLQLCSLASIIAIVESSNYTETGECEAEDVCNYFYSAQQEFVNSEGDQYTKVNASVDITCTSSGTYNASDAKLYCMSVKNVNIWSNSLENSSDNEIRMIRRSINEQLGNWFCFVQSYSGSIPAVYHLQSEPDHVVSLKKSIAAAFQANFQGTDEEEETDPQSHHKSQYTYSPHTEDGMLKMHRKIRKVDVSAEEQSEQVDTEQDEDIQYRSGRLERSSGNTTVHLVNNSHSNSEESQVSLSQALAASGSYIMELKTCRKLGKYAYGVQKRRILSEMGQCKEEDLKAARDKKNEAFERMRLLREKLPSGSVLEALQDYNNLGDEVVQILLTLTELESEYGAPPSYVPVINDVMTFVVNLPSVRNVREVVVMILSMDGSLESQMAILGAYDNAIDNAEANVILTHISLMKTVKIEFVIGMEERLAQPPDDVILTHQLLLVFSSLATKGSDEVEDRVMNLLSTRTAILNSRTHPDLSDINLLLHALGNTGSKVATSLTLSFLDAESDRYSKIKFIVIDSLSKATDDPVVLSRLEELLREDPFAECAEAILDTLRSGFEYTNTREQGVVQYSSQIKSHTLLYLLAEVVSFSNNTDLHTMMAEYLKKVKADDALFDIVYSESSPLGSRGKRGTTDWDSGENSDYNYIDSLLNRQMDVNTYDSHNAYIGAKRIGGSNAHLRIAYGYFVGYSTTCDEMKAFGRYKVVGSILKWTVALADVKVSIEAATGSGHVIAYAKIGTNTLLNNNTVINNLLGNSSYCRSHTSALAEYRARLFSLSFGVWIYVGRLTLNVNVDGHFNLDINANVCLGRTRTEVTGALAAFSPTIGITLSGEISANLLYLVKGGVTLSATFNYRLEPVVGIQACPASCSLTARTCIGVYDSWPNNILKLQGWWQHQTLKLCGGGWFRYPCLKWSRRYTWDELTEVWDIGSRGREVVWQDCEGNLHPTCAERALSSPLFEQ